MKGDNYKRTSTVKKSGPKKQQRKSTLGLKPPEPAEMSDLPLPPLPPNEAIEEFQTLRAIPLSNLEHQVKRLRHCHETSRPIVGLPGYKYALTAMEVHAVEAMWALADFLKQLKKDAANYKDENDGDEEFGD